jgi:hypothetical protein
MILVGFSTEVLSPEDDELKMEKSGVYPVVKNERVQRFSGRDSSISLGREVRR